MSAFLNFTALYLRSQESDQNEPLPNQVAEAAPMIRRAAAYVLSASRLRS